MIIKTVDDLETLDAVELRRIIKGLLEKSIGEGNNSIMMGSTSINEGNRHVVFVNRYEDGGRLVYRI